MRTAMPASLAKEIESAGILANKVGEIISDLYICSAKWACSSVG